MSRFTACSQVSAKERTQPGADSLVHLALIGVLVGLAYYAGAMIGFALTFPNSSVSTLWPPNAILLAALLLLPRQRWWLVFLSAFPAHLAVQLQSGVPILMILCWFISNSCEALIGAYCVRRFVANGMDFASLKNSLFYVAFAALLAPFLSSFLDAAFVVLVGWKEQSYWNVWSTRFASNVLAALAIPPFIVLWSSKGIVWLTGASWRRYAEAGLLFAGGVVVSFLVFSWQQPGSATTPALLYLPLPFLLWAAMRFGAGGASTALLILVLASIFGAAKGGGPFVNSSPAENVFSLQIFLIAISLPLIFLAGLVEEQRDKAKVLSESEERFRTMANTAPVMIWMSGTDKLCTFFNKSWLDFAGRSMEQELGNGWTEGVHREDFVRCLNSYVNAFDARREFTMEYRLRRHDGEYRYVLDTGVPRFEPGGEFLGYIGCATDVTERREAVFAAQRHRAELAHMTRISTMGELGASLAHELSQPLTAILSNAQAAQRFMASDPADLAEVRAIHTDIVHDASRAGEVIRRMRALVRKEQRDFVALDLSTVISDVVALLHSDAILHNVRVTLDMPRNLPPVRGDKVELQQVVMNLVLNAFDAMEDFPGNEREITIQIRTDDAGTLQVSVRDRGPGLISSDLDKVFQPFYTTKREGLGMGLSISRSIVEAHGGRLWAENNADGGASFYFTVLVEEKTSGIG